MSMTPETNYVPIEPKHYWPGGIPTSVRFQPESEIPEDQLKEECRAWAPAPHMRLDISNPNQTTNYCHDIPRYSFIVLPKVDHSNPANHVHWIKLLILLNRFDSVRDNHLVCHDPIHALVLAGDGSEGQSVRPPLSKEKIGPWIYLETSSFYNICMTQHGTVVYTGLHYHFVVDQTNLDERATSAVDFDHNGEIKNETRFRPFWIDMVLHTLGESSSVKSIEDGVYNMALPRNYNVHFDINAPILDITETARGVRPDSIKTPDFIEVVEHYGPRYLAMEAQRREAEYDEAPLVEALFLNM